METTLRSFIVVLALLTSCLMGCGGVDDDTQPETADSQSSIQSGGTPGTVPPAEPSRPDTSMTEGGGWQIYRNQECTLTFRYPPTYVLRVREDTSDPDQLLRIGLLSPHAVGSPLEDRFPPDFAVDVYYDPAGRSIEEWLIEKKGFSPDNPRYGLSAVTIGGLPGLSVTYRIQLAPNTFYYVAREGYVYRFTPLGLHSRQILESVQFEP